MLPHRKRKVIFQSKADHYLSCLSMIHPKCVQKIFEEHFVIFPNTLKLRLGVCGRFRPTMAIWLHAQYLLCYGFAP